MRPTRGSRRYSTIIGPRRKTHHFALSTDRGAFVLSEHAGNQASAMVPVGGVGVAFCGGDRIEKFIILH